MSSSPRPGRTGERHASQWLTLGIGVVYLLIGVVGFLVTGLEGFADPDGQALLGIFEVNPLHNVVHLLLGAAGLALWNQLHQARVYGWLLVAVLGLTFVYGLFVASSDTAANVLALNPADNVLHVFTALAGLAIALSAGRRVGDRVAR